MKFSQTFKSSFEQKLLLAFVTLLSGIVILATITYKNNRIHERTFWQIEHTSEVLYHTEEMSNSLKELESGVREYIITKDSVFLQPFIKNQQSIFRQLYQLKTLTSDNSVQQVRLDSLHTLVKQRVKAARQSIDLINTKGFATAQDVLQKNADIDINSRIENLLDQLERDENRLLGLRKKANSQSSQDFTLFYFTLISVLALTLAIFFVVLWQNLKAKKKAENSLSENKELLQSIIDNTSSIIYVKDREERYIMVNRKFESSNGISKEGAIGKTDFDIFPEAQAQALYKTDQQIKTEKKLIELEESFFIDGSLQNYYSVKYPLFNQKGELYAMGGICTNITGMISRQQLQTQKDITETTIEAQEKERSHLARELHDNVNQLLVSAGLMLEVALDNPEDSERYLRRSKETVFQASTEIRNLSHTLSAPMVEEDSFIDSIRDLVDDINLSGTAKARLVLHSQQQFRHLTDKAKLTLYRIIQEQLSNILKHAEATHVLIELKTENENLCLSVSDDGVGFNPVAKSQGIGLRNIQNRIELYSGTMKINSVPGQGCTLRVEMPLQGA